MPALALAYESTGTVAVVMLHYYFPAPLERLLGSTYCPLSCLEQQQVQPISPTPASPAAACPVHIRAERGTSSFLESHFYERTALKPQPQTVACPLRESGMVPDELWARALPSQGGEATLAGCCCRLVSLANVSTWPNNQLVEHSCGRWGSVQG